MVHDQFIALTSKRFPGSVALWQKKGRVLEVSRSLKSKRGAQASVKMVAADVPI